MIDGNRESSRKYGPRAFTFRVALLLCALASETATACRFNVRDVGFVELEDAPYRLEVPQDAAPEWKAAVARAAQALLPESNVRFSGATGESSPRGGTSPAQARSILLTAAGGGHLLLGGAVEEASLERSAWSLVEEVADSPARRELARLLPESFAVVVVLSGSDAEAAVQAYRSAEEAIATLRPRLDTLPKAVDAELRILCVEKKVEQVLAWALGLQANWKSEAAVTIVYGRGAVLGPPLTGMRITPAAIRESLWLVGQDCECELDRGILRSRRLPLTWNETTREHTARALGFDPESPLVRSEMARILARGPNAGPVPSLEAVLESSADQAFGYVEDAGAATSLPDSIAGTKLLAEDDLDRLIAAATGEATSVEKNDAPSRRADDAEPPRLLGPAALDAEDDHLDAEDDHLRRVVLRIFAVIGASVVALSALLLVIARRRR